MWNFGGGGGNPWLQGLVQRMGAARGGGQQQPMFGLGGLFSRMGQGWGGGGDRTMQPHGSPMSMSFAPQQFAAQGGGLGAGFDQGPMKLNPEMANSGQDNYWGYGQFANPNPSSEQRAPNTFTPTSSVQRMGGGKLTNSAQSSQNAAAQRNNAAYNQSRARDDEEND